MKSFEPPRAVLSGSFRRDVDGLRGAYRELVVGGCQILSPHRMWFDEAEFVRDSAEAGMSVGAIERHHLLSIVQSDFVWLHMHKGHIGVSAALEIGFAVAHRKPIFARQTPGDPVAQEFIRTVPSVYDALCQIGYFESKLPQGNVSIL